MSEIAGKLNEQGIRLKAYAIGQHYSTCPQCSHTRKGANKSKPCLSVKIDDSGGAAWNCHHCEWVGNVPGDRRDGGNYYHKPEPKTYRTPEPPKVVNRGEALYKFFQSRGISDETVDDAGVYLGKNWFPQTGKEEPCIVFPYVENGVVVNNKYRAKGKHFRQDKDAKRTLYNLDQIATDVLYWVEGEIDVLALMEIGIRSVVSLPDGAPKTLKDEKDPERESDRRFEAIANSVDRLRDVKKHIICTDADGPGTNLAEEIARRMGKAKCSRVYWPAGSKDPDEALLNHGPDGLREILDQAEPYPIEGLHRLSHMSLLRYRQHKREKLYPTPWSSLNMVMQIPDDGRLFVVTGVPGSGKSEWFDHVMIHTFKEYNWHATVFSPENAPVEMHFAKLAEKWAGKPFESYGSTIEGMSDYELMDAESALRRHVTMILQDDEEKTPSLDRILEMASLSVAQSGSKWLVIDPWNEIEHNKPPGMSEADYLNQTLGRLKRWGISHACNVVIVAHPTKLYPDKSGKVQPPGGYEISGGAGWSNKADFGITVHRPNAIAETDPNAQPGGSPTLTSIHVWKVRFKTMGKRGRADLQWDKFTGLYADIH